MDACSHRAIAKTIIKDGPMELFKKFSASETACESEPKTTQGKLKTTLICAAFPPC